MKLCNDVITVFNARVDPETGGRVWIPTRLGGVSWHGTDASALDAARGGMTAANRVVIRVPTDVDAGGKAYVDPLAYAAAADVGGLWTLQSGDFIVKGDAAATGCYPGAQSPGGEGWTPATLRRAFPDCATVLAVTDNTRNHARAAGGMAPNAPHWRVTGT